MFCNSPAARLPMWARLGLAGLALLLTLPLALAQTPAALAASAAHSRPDPLNAKAAVPAALYLSPLRTYQAYAETPVAPWRETNERVLQRGGWRNYAREAQAPASAPASAASAASPAAHNHGTKGSP